VLHRADAALHQSFATMSLMGSKTVLTAPLPVYPEQRTSSDRPGWSGWVPRAVINDFPGVPRARGPCLKWVKLRNTQHEQMSSGLLPIADIDGLPARP
jgi:hypothetical protein